MIKDDGYDSDGGAIILGGIIKVVIFVWSYGINIEIKQIIMIILESIYLNLNNKINELLLILISCKKYNKSQINDIVCDF